MRARGAILVLVLVLCHAFVAEAQRIAMRVDLLTLGWGVITVRPVEADGDASTSEWLARRMGVHCPANACGHAPSDTYRVVAVTTAGICAGPWFEAPNAQIAHVDGRDVLIAHPPVSHPANEALLLVIALDRPIECHD